MKTEAVQIALFHTAETAVAGELWYKAFNAFPPNSQSIAEGHTGASGTFGALNLELQSQASRVDLYVTVSVPAERGPVPEPLEDDAPALDLGIRTALAITAQVPSISRLGLVLHRTIVTKSPVDAIHAVQSRVPFLKIPDKANEADFRIAVPIEAEGPANAPMLAVVRWQTGQRAFVSTQVHSASGMPSFTMNMQTIASENIDVNTHPAYDATTNSPEAILHHLRGIATKISEVGYDAL